MATDADRGPKPGYLGTQGKTISFSFDSLAEYKELVDDGVLDLNFPEFVRQAVAHELARYRAEGRTTKKRRT